MLRTTVKELYGLQGDTGNATDAIAINYIIHVISTLSEKMRFHANMLTSFS